MTNPIFSGFSTMIYKYRRVRTGSDILLPIETETNPSAMTVKLRRTNARYRGLTPGQPYVVIGIEGDDFRILNDAGRPYLYPPGLFKVLDTREPGDWVAEYGDDGERYAYPAPLNTPG